VRQAGLVDRLEWTAGHATSDCADTSRPSAPSALALAEAVDSMQCATAQDTYSLSLQRERSREKIVHRGLWIAA
jgi:hypothetical protein